jgi:hypothetical protein
LLLVAHRRPRHRRLKGRAGEAERQRSPGRSEVVGARCSGEAMQGARGSAVQRCSVGVEIRFAGVGKLRRWRRCKGENPGWLGFPGVRLRGLYRRVARVLAQTPKKERRRWDGRGAGVRGGIKGLCGYGFGHGMERDRARVESWPTTAVDGGVTLTKRPAEDAPVRCRDAPRGKSRGGAGGVR